MYPNFISHIHKYVEIDDNSVSLLLKYISPLKLKQKEFLLKEGQICHSIYFVERGCLRMYFIDNKLNEQLLNSHWNIGGWPIILAFWTKNHHRTLSKPSKNRRFWQLVRPHLKRC